MGLTSKRMKFIFKKFLDFEKAHGTDETVEKVKEAAAKYVEKSSTSVVSGQEQEEDNKPNGGVHSDKKMQENLKKNLNL